MPSRSVTQKAVLSQVSNEQADARTQPALGEEEPNGAMPSMHSQLD